jgi:Ala-tRNA(Pro) deacylase
MRIAEFLVEQRVPFEPLPHPPAFSAQKRARCLHITGRQVAKNILLRGPGGPFLAILPATDQVDTQALARAFGGPIRLANEREIAAVFGDCEWGVVPPFGTLYGLPSLLEDSIPADTLLVLETHTHVDAIRLPCRDFERLERPRRLRFAIRVDSTQ